MKQTLASLATLAIWIVEILGFTAAFLFTVVAFAWLIRGALCALPW